LASHQTTAPEFVSFHADRPAGAGGPHPNANLQSKGYMRMLDLLFRSARLAHPDARCTLLTDETTEVRGIHGAVRHLQTRVDHGSLMLSRSLAQLACIEQSDFARPLVLLDSDILLRGSLQPLFEEDFDVGLTWRETREMPINGGLLVLHNRRPEVGRRFFERFVATYRERYASDGNAAWYGDQLALRDCVGLGPHEIRKLRVLEHEGCRIRFLPCETYNFSPDNRLAAIADGLPDKLVLHFKGQRKRLMEPFWEVFLQPHESRLPWVGWLGKRARRRLEQAMLDEERSATAAAAAKADA
jgi:hypothetical protein